jgi:hypothetical protein
MSAEAVRRAAIEADGEGIIDEDEFHELTPKEMGPLIWGHENGNEETFASRLEYLHIAHDVSPFPCLFATSHV